MALDNDLQRPGSTQSAGNSQANAQARANAAEIFSNLSKAQNEGKTLTANDVKQQLNTALKNVSSSEMLKTLQFLKKEIKNQTKISNDTYKANVESIKQDKNLSEEEKDIQLRAIEKQKEADDKTYQVLYQGIGSKQSLVVAGLHNVSSTLGSIGGAMSKHYQEVIDINNKNRSVINTRLQGIGETQDKWGKMQTEISRSFGMSMILNEKSILQNLAKAVEAGIANNVEQRAMLQTLSENIANTFEAFSAELTRFIRLQQADITTLALGMESSLNTFLNQQYRDSSYLSQVGTSNIAGSLFEAMSQMDAAQAQSFNFTVQKWLGSLYSLGMSQSAIQSIAQGIGQAYSGDVTGLSSQMQNLLAMSATRSGQSYASILTQGINGSDVNQLMQSMVQYLAEIAQDTNHVVETQYGGIFGMSVSDLKAAANLAANLEPVFGLNTSTRAMLGQTQSMIGSIGERLGLSGMLQNLKENFFYTTAANIVSSPIGQFLYETITDMSDLIDTRIPGIMAAGFGIDFAGNKISDFIRAGIGGMSVISGIATVINALSSGNGFTNLSSDWWDTTGLVPKGTSLSGISGTGSGASLSVAGGAGSDISKSELQSAASSAKETQGMDESAGTPPDHTIDDVYTQIEDYSAIIKQYVQEIRDGFFGVNRKSILVEIANPIFENNGENQSVRTIIDNSPTSPVPVEYSTFMNQAMPGQGQETSFGTAP